MRKFENSSSECVQLTHFYYFKITPSELKGEILDVIQVVFFLLQTSS